MTSAPDTTERTALVHFLNASRGAALAVVDGLSEADARRSIVPSGWSPFDLVVHLGGVERHWFAHTLAGDAAHTPALDLEPTTLAEAVELVRAEIARSDQILGRLSLDDPLVLQPAELVGEVTTVRGVLLHVIEELARHAGHLDIARELIDGRTGLGPR
ncbi:MAG TPA: DinB family protein [Microlunatus sp.]|nr:DinB family protein [Microlunatus sp.]